MGKTNLNAPRTKGAEDREFAEKRQRRNLATDFHRLSAEVKGKRHPSRKAAPRTEGAEDRKNTKED